jgi:hypothetical protein
MATLSLSYTYPDGQGTRLLNAFAAGASYDTLKIGNETKQQFLERMVKLYMMRNVVKGEADAAAQTAYASAVATANSELGLT